MLSLGLAASACDGAHGAHGARADAEPSAEDWRAAGEERFVEGAIAYGTYCALCHGVDANGYAADHAPSLVSATFLESATDEQIARGMREGRPGTAMASYAKNAGGPLDEADIAAIVAFLRDKGPPRIRLPPGAVSGDAARGEVVYDTRCKTCHGTRTDAATAVHLGNRSFLQNVTDGFLQHAIVHGRPGTPMPAFAGILRSDEIDNVVAFLRSWVAPAEVPHREPPEPPPLDKPIINPGGPSPEFTLRDGRFLPIDDVKRAIDAKKRIVVIDARAVPDWASMHIPGAISVPYYSFARLDQLPKDGTWITAYCACPHHASGAVVDELRRRGFKNTAVLDEGILEWKKRGYPTVSTVLPPSP
jgi:mono/diheme cytochrome c family protein/rhodanese-related sulfurtransferase